MGDFEAAWRDFIGPKLHLLVPHFIFACVVPNRSAQFFCISVKVASENPRAVRLQSTIVP